MEAERLWNAVWPAATPARRPLAAVLSRRGGTGIALGAHRPGTPAHARAPDPEPLRAALDDLDEGSRCWHNTLA